MLELFVASLWLSNKSLAQTTDAVGERARAPRAKAAQRESRQGAKPSEPVKPLPNLTLAEALRRGLAFSPDIQRAQSELKEAEANYRLTEASVLPTLDLKGSVGSQKTSGAYRSGFSNTTGQTEFYRAQIVGSQPLYQGGAIGSGLAAARTRKKMAEQKVFDARQRYAQQIVQAYLQAAQNEVGLTIARDNREILKSYAEITARYAAIGRSKNIDRLTAEASYNLSEAEVLNAEIQREQGHVSLLRLMGEEPTPQELRINTNLVLQPAETGNLDELYMKAIKSNPQVRAKELEIEALKHENQARLSKHYPKLSLDGSWGYDSPDQPNWFKEASQAYSVSLNLTIPLFSGLSSFSERSAQAERVHAIERDLQNIRLDLRRSLGTALVSLDKEFRRLKLTQTSSQGARRAMEVAVRDYRNGLLSSLDVLNIQRTRFDADRQYTSAQYTYHQHVVTLRKDLGIDLERVYTREFEEGPRAQ
jgi:outer membrane protein